MTLTPEGRQVAQEILDHLLAAHEPIREDALHERMDISVTPGRFIGVLDQLLSEGKVGLHPDHDPPVNQPRPEPPFEPRYWFRTPH